MFGVGVPSLHKSSQTSHLDCLRVFKVGGPGARYLLTGRSHYIAMDRPNVLAQQTYKKRAKTSAELTENLRQSLNDYGKLNVGTALHRFFSLNDYPC